jgi:GABA(A) receptor-associated protein
MSNFKFKNSFPFSNRLDESQRVMEKYSDRVPIICEKNTSCRDAPNIDKTKYLVPRDLTIGQFMYVIRKRIKLGPEKGLFLFINEKILPSSLCINEIYHSEKDIDGFLYISYATENTFGNINSTFQ